MNILNEIAHRTRERINEKKKTLSMESIVKIAGQTEIQRTFPFERAMENEDISFICEIKKASPSRGIISEDFPYPKIAKEYEAAGAAAISVLTEPFYFKGSDLYLRELADFVQIPLLRKDFVVDSYMIYESKLLGASCILLICSILDNKSLFEYIEIAHSLGLSALVETNNEKEVEMALNAGARIIGVNNRDLKTFQVDLSLSERLRKKVPEDKIFISESGIKTRPHIEMLRKIRTDAVLIGEALMLSPNKKEALIRLKGGEIGEN